MQSDLLLSFVNIVRSSAHYSHDYLSLQGCGQVLGLVALGAPWCQLASASMDCAMAAPLRQPCLPRRPVGPLVHAAGPLLGRRYLAPRYLISSSPRAAALNFPQVPLLSSSLLYWVSMLAPTCTQPLSLDLLDLLSRFQSRADDDILLWHVLYHTMILKLGFRVLQEWLEERREDEWKAADKVVQAAETKSHRLSLHLLQAAIRALYTGLVRHCRPYHGHPTPIPATSC